MQSFYVIRKKGLFPPDCEYWYYRHEFSKHVVWAKKYSNFESAHKYWKRFKNKGFKVDIVKFNCIQEEVTDTYH